MQFAMFMYWEGFRHGREWANACSFSKETLAKAEKALMERGITPLTPTTKDELVNAMRKAQ